MKECSVQQCLMFIESLLGGVCHWTGEAHEHSVTTTLELLDSSRGHEEVRFAAASTSVLTRCRLEKTLPRIIVIAES